MSDERAPAEPGEERLLFELSDVRRKGASQTGRREAAFRAQRCPMKQRRQTKHEREVALNSATSDGRVPDEP